MLQRARYVRIVYRDSYLTTFRKIIRNKLVLASFVLIAIGIALIAVSYQHNDIVHSEFVQESTVSSTNGTFSSVYFNQPARMNVTVQFSMPSNSVAHYDIYGVDNYTTNYQVKSTTFFVTSGYIGNGSTVSIHKITGNQGQKYLVKLQSVGTGNFQVHVVVTSNIYLVEPSQRNIGGPGVMLGMAGAVLLAARISVVYKSIKGF